MTTELQFCGVYDSGYSQLVLNPGQTVIVRGTIGDSEGDGEHSVAVVFGPNGIEIKLEGYGEKCAEDGHGSPVFVEFHEGEAWVRVWDDISIEDPKSISLENAREDRRFECGERVRTIAVGRPHLVGVISDTKVIGGKVQFRVVETSVHYDGHEFWFTADEMEHER